MDSLDVHSEILFNSYMISRVGVTGIKKQASIIRNGKTNVLSLVIEVGVDLPSYMKGSHLSRNAEVLAEIVDDSLQNPVNSLEDLAKKISLELLEKHSYAKHAEVSIDADFYLMRGMREDKESLEPFTLHAISTSTREGDKIKTSKHIGVEVLGMTACPCAMETCRSFLINDHSNEETFLNSIPVISHNQRNRVTLFIEVPDDKIVNAEDMIDIVESSFSSPTYNILKRIDEGRVVWQAHENPKFVEDVVRDVLTKVVNKYTDLPDEVHVSVKSVSEESIHKYNAYADRSTTIGELRSKKMEN